MHLRRRQAPVLPAPSPPRPVSGPPAPQDAAEGRPPALSAAERAAVDSLLSGLGAETAGRLLAEPGRAFAAPPVERCRWQNSLGFSTQER